MPEGNTISSSLLAKILNGLYGNEPVSFAIFLKDYVIEGAQYTITPGNPKRFTISPSIIALGDEMYRTNEPKSFQTNAPNTTYYVDYVAGKGYRFSVDHPLESHLMLWRIETGSNGAISSAVDLRGAVGGVQFDDNISLIPDLIVNTTNIVNNAVTTAKLADGSVTTPKLANGAVVTAKIGTGAVVTTNLGDGSVTTDKISNSAVTSGKIADANVITNKIADNAVTTVKINNGAVTTAKINDGAVTSDKLENNSVINTKIPDGSITSGKIQNGAITTDKINNLGVTSGKISDSAVTEVKINNNAVTAGKIASNAVTTVKIQNGAVTLPKLGTDVINYIDSIEGETNLSDLQDVDVNTRADGRVLAWDEDSSSYVFVEQTGGGGEVETNFQVNQKVFTATSNQTVFDISDTGTYETSKNYLKVWVAGVIQVLTTNFTETSSTTFTLTSGVPSGTQVIAEWFEGVGTGGGGGASNLSDLDDVNPAAKADGRILQWNASSSKHVYVNPTTTPSAHAASHLTGGSDAIPVAVAGVSPGLMSAAQALSLANVVEDVGDLSGLPAQVGGLDLDVSDLQSAVGDLISDVGDLSSTVGGLSSTVGGLSSTVGGLSSSVGDLEDTVSALSSEVSGLSGLSSTISGLSDDVSDLSDAVGNMSTVTTTSKVVAGAINELKAQSALKGPSTAPGFPLTLTVGSGKQFSTIQAAFDTINDRYVSGNIIIDIDPGTYAESPVMKGVSGPCLINIRPSTGSVFDNSAPIVITGSSGLSFIACTVEIVLYNVRLTSGSGTQSFYKVDRCSIVQFMYCCRTISNGSNCFYLLNSNVVISGGEYSNQSFLLSAHRCNVNVGTITASDNYIGIQGIASLLVVKGDLGAATFIDPTSKQSVISY